MARRRIACDHPPRLEIEDANIVLAVKCYELVCTESEFS